MSKSSSEIDIQKSIDQDLYELEEYLDRWAKNDYHWYGDLYARVLNLIVTIRRKID